MGYITSFYFLPCGFSRETATIWRLRSHQGMADLGRHVLWERLGGDALFAKIIQLLNDGWLSKSIAHSERSSSLFNYGGNLEGDITSTTRPQKGNICTLYRSRLL